MFYKAYKTILIFLKEKKTDIFNFIFLYYYILGYIVLVRDSFRSVLNIIEISSPKKIKSS